MAVGADTQLTLINRRWLDLIAGRPLSLAAFLAGDQLVVDLDLSKDNLPPGTVLQAGTATLVVTTKPHTGLQEVPGPLRVDAMKVMSTDEGYRLRLRGNGVRQGRRARVRAPGDAITTRRSTPARHRRVPGSGDCVRRGGDGVVRAPSTRSRAPCDLAR